jgi:hypothetical protein
LLLTHPEEQLMKPFLLVGLTAVAIVAGAGCNREKTQTPADSSKTAKSNLVNPKITIARGCLTGDAGQFVLTNLDQAAPSAATDKGLSAGEPVAATESYRLVGMDDRLRSFVGQRVEVTGDSQPEGVVDLVSATPAAAPTNQPAATSGSDAKVSTATRARVEIHELRVNSVSPLGDKCLGK